MRNPIEPARKGGNFEYSMTCIQDTSGDEILSKVTAAKEDEAKSKCL